MGKQGSSQKQGSSEADTCRSPRTLPDAERELLQPLLLHIERDSHIPLPLLNPILAGVATMHEESAALALRSLGYILHHENIVAAFSDDCALAVLSCLFELITSTDQKALCSLGVWCLGIQEFGVPLLEAQIHLILQAIVHAVDNPMGSKAVTYEALQALVKMVCKVPKMRSMASVWAPPTYRRLLSADKRDRDMAERCLKDVEMFLLPPTSSLSKVVALDISQTLLSSMEKMVRSRALVVPTIRAWSWFVRLLGNQAGENKVLVNQMLKVAEITFTIHDSQVQIASLVAWEALIDVLFLYPAQPRDELQNQTDAISPSSQNFHKLSPATPSVKRLKLLMVPLITIMSGASLQSVKLACWRTWTYLSHKLDFGINSLPVQAVVVTPMFEVIFKAGPERGTLGVWDLCLNALEALIACKFQDKLDSRSAPATYIGLEGRVSSPKTPTLSKPTEDEAETLPIKWVPWSLEALESILKLIKVLWLFGVRNLKQFSGDNLSLNRAIRMLFLVIRGIDAEGKGSIKPSTENVKSVHTVLKLLSELSLESGLLAGIKRPVSTLWPAFEVMLEFGYLVLSSSFYKLSFLYPDNRLKDGNFLGPLSNSSTKEAVHMSPGLGDPITPIAYMVATWIQVGCTVFCKNEEEAKALEKLEKLAECTKAGLGIMNNLQGVAIVLDWFFSHELGKTLGVQENSLAPEVETTAGAMMDSSQVINKGYFFLQVWNIFASQLASYIEASNDVPAVESGIGNSGYQVVYKFLLLPIQLCLKITDLPFNVECISKGHSSHKDTELVRLSQSPDELDVVVAVWTRLYDCSLRVSSLKSSQSNSFASAYCQKVLKLLEAHWQCGHDAGDASGKICLSTGILGSVVKHVLRQTDISSLATLAINRKKRLGSFIGGSCPSNGVVGNDIEDASNVRDILSLTSRLLDLSWNELTAGKTCWFSPASRVLAALAGFVPRMYSQQDALLLLQEFSRPLVHWLNPSNSSSIKQMTCPSEVLWKALQDLWEKLLNFLQRCQPPLTFDSNLLSLQAPLLVPALQHSETLISNTTLSFWQATYGSKESVLKYPPCLVPVLQELKKKVKIILPGWEKNFGNALKGKMDSDYFLELDVETPAGGRKPLQRSQERLLERRRGSFGTVTSTDPKSKSNEVSLHPSTRPNMKGKPADKPVHAVLEKMKRPVGKSHAFDVSTGVANAGLNNAEDTIHNSKDAKPHEIQRGEKSDQSSELKERVENGACMYSEAVQTIKEPHQESASNVITPVAAGEILALQCDNASTEPREHLVLPHHGAQSTDRRTFLEKAKNNNVLPSECDLETSTRRKKLTFLDDDSLEYTPIPLSLKKAGPLTEHQKEVRLAQSGTIGNECGGHGAGIKTYTSMDFSQSQIAFDSEDPDEILLEIAAQVLKADEKTNARQAEQGPVLQKRSKEDVEGFVSATPLEKLHEGTSVSSSDGRAESNLTVSRSEAPAATMCGEIQPVRALAAMEPICHVLDQGIAGSGLLHDKCHKRQHLMLTPECALSQGVKQPQYEHGVAENHKRCRLEPQPEQYDMGLGSSKNSGDYCKATDNGNFLKKCASQPSLVPDCMERGVVQQMQPVETQLCDTQICDTQPCDSQMSMDSDDRGCIDSANAPMRRPGSDEDFVKQIGTQWAVCDLLNAASASPHWNSMDLKSLENAQKLIAVLQMQVHKSKKRLFAKNSP